MKFKKSSLLITALFGASIMPAQANDTMFDLLKVLRDQGTISSKNYDLLVNAANNEKNANDSAAEETPKITTTGKIKIESADKKWAFQPLGRIMFDFIDTDEDGSGAEDFKGTELRRARLGFAGSIEDWNYKFETDFAGGDASIKDAYVGYGTKLAGNKAGIKLGQSHIPFGLTTKVSSKYMSFLDRPYFADSSVSPARQAGIVTSIADPDYKWSLGASYTYAGSKGYKGFSEGEAEESNGTTVALRGSFLPYMKDKKHLLQLGLGYLKLSEGAEKYSFEQRLVSHVDAEKHLKASVEDFTGSDAFTIDALGVSGSFHTMAEYVNYEIGSESGNDVSVDGYAIEAGYFLTGESLKWKKGYTSGITPKSSKGAWQVAARFESTEIEDRLEGNDAADKFTVGVNYYPTKNTRMVLNYDKVTDLTINGANADFNPSSLKLRTEVFW